MGRYDDVAWAVVLRGPRSSSDATPPLRTPQPEASVRITDVEITRLEAALPDALRRVRQRSVRMQDLYERSDPTEYHDRVVCHYVTLVTDSGAHGVYGPIDRAALGSIRNGLADVLIGSDPLRQNLLWERMLRSERHLRTGHGLMGVSALDNVLWDLRGRHYDQPVYELLGGATRPTVPAYASTLGYSHEADEVARRASELATSFTAQKWFFAHGPREGDKALQDSVALAQRLRSTVGDGYPLMFDAVMGWDLALAEAWCRRVADVGPTWLEEPFPAYDLGSYRALASRTSVPLAAGEHVYGRWEARSWIDHDVLRYLQCDPEWTGGVSELCRIATLCSASGVILVAHGANIHAALHVTASLPPWVAPYVEWLIDLVDERALFERQPLAPTNGEFMLPTRSGFGIELAFDRADAFSTWSATRERHHG